MNTLTFFNSGAASDSILDLVKDYLKYDATEEDKKNSESILSDPDHFFTFKEVDDGIQIERK